MIVEDETMTIAEVVDHIVAMEDSNLIVKSVTKGITMASLEFFALSIVNFL